MNNLPNGGLHSGASFGCVMREMQLLAIEGEDAHKQIYINPLLKSKANPLLIKWSKIIPLPY